MLTSQTSRLAVWGRQGKAWVWPAPCVHVTQGQPTLPLGPLILRHQPRSNQQPPDVNRRCLQLWRSDRSGAFPANKVKQQRLPLLPCIGGKDGGVWHRCPWWQSCSMPRKQPATRAAGSAESVIRTVDSGVCTAPINTSHEASTPDKAGVGCWPGRCAHPLHIACRSCAWKLAWIVYTACPLHAACISNRRASNSSRAAASLAWPSDPPQVDTVAAHHVQSVLWSAHVCDCLEVCG
jgi:hypothetical protein